MKLDKDIVQRRVDLMAAEGVVRESDIGIPCVSKLIGIYCIDFCV